MSYELDIPNVQQLTDNVGALEKLIRQPGFYKDPRALKAVRVSLEVLDNYIDAYIVEHEQLVFESMVDLLTEVS